MNNHDLHIVKNELFDVDIIEDILRDNEKYNKYDLNRLKTYKKHRLGGNVVQVVYHYGKGCEELELGRLYVKNNIGLQSFPRDIRNPLLDRHYWDVDMANAHFSLMIKLGHEWNIKVDNIKYYCDNRNECLNKVSSNRKIAKTSYLKVAYGGNVKLHDENYNDDGIAPDGDLTILRLVENEVKSLMDMCYTKYEQYHKLVSKKENKKASLFALVLQTEERKCLLILDEFMKTQGRQADILIHDGLEIRKLENEKIFPEILLRGGEKAIFDSIGHSIKLVQKPIEHNYRKMNENQIIIDDVFAAKKFISLMGTHIVRDCDDVYYFNDIIGIWECGDTAFRVNVSKYKEHLVFYDKDSNKKINYGGFEKNVSAMRKWILPSLVDNGFISKNIDTSLGKLLFSNGIYDFETDKFTEGFNSNIIFFKRINREFPTHRNEELITFVNDTLFVKAFDNEDGKLAGEYLKKALCMAIYGDYTRKKFYISVGLSNSGKGVLVNAITQTFESFIEEYDANNLLYNPNCSTDEAKRLSWLKDLFGIRLAFSNEIRLTSGISSGIDGNLLKSISSGGDNLKVRGNYESQKSFVNRSTMFLLANDCPSILPIDSGVKSRCSFIKYQLRFVDDPKESDERQADPSIKQKFKNDDYKNALFNLLQDTYKLLTKKEKQLGGHIIEPSCVIQETNSWISDEKTIFLEKLNEVYEITNDINDFVESKRIIDYLINDCKMRISANKIGMILKKIIKLDKSDAVIKNKRCRLGIKERTIKII